MDPDVESFGPASSRTSHHFSTAGSPTPLVLPQSGGGSGVGSIGRFMDTSLFGSSRTPFRFASGLAYARHNTWVDDDDDVMPYSTLADGTPSSRRPAAQAVVSPAAPATAHRSDHHRLHPLTSPRSNRVVVGPDDSMTFNSKRENNSTEGIEAIEKGGYEEAAAPCNEFVPDERNSPLPKEPKPASTATPPPSFASAYHSHPSNVCATTPTTLARGTRLSFGEVAGSTSSGRHGLSASATIDDDIRFARSGGVSESAGTAFFTSSASPSSLPNPMRSPGRPEAATAAAAAARAKEVKDLAQRYFTILQQSADVSRGDVSAGSDSDADDAPAATTATPSKHHQQSPRKKAVGSKHHHHHHPHAHLIHRRYELIADASGACCLDRLLGAEESGDKTNASDQDATDTTTTGKEETDTSNNSIRQTVFNCAPELSAMVNMSDVALCHIIELRSQFSLEVDGYRELCRATQVASAAIASKLHPRPASSSPARDEPTTGADHLHLDADQNVGPEDEQKRQSFQHEAVVLVNRLITYVRGQPAAEALLQQLLTVIVDTSLPSDSCDDPKPSSPPFDESVFSGVVRILKSLLSEAEFATTLGGVDRAEMGDTAAAFQLPELMDALAADHIHEEEARALGNLTLGASTRRESLQRLHGALTRCLDEIHRTNKQLRSHRAPNNVDHPIDGALDTAAHSDDPARSVESRTDSAVAEVATAARRVVQQSRERQDRAEETLRIHHQRVLDATQEQEALKSNHEAYLFDNETAIQQTLKKIDELHAVLENQVHERSVALKDFAQRYGESLIHLETLRRNLQHAQQHSSQVIHTATDVDRVASGWHRTISEEIPPMLTAFRQTVRSKHAADYEASKQYLSQLFDDTVKVATMQRSASSQWMDVLLRNQARETERAATLQLSIRDALERYHQEDVDLFKMQLEECLQRKRKIELEMEALEAQVRADERRASQIVPNFSAAFLSATQQQHNNSSFQHNTSTVFGGASPMPSRPTSHGASSASGPVWSGQQPRSSHSQHSTHLSRVGSTSPPPLPQQHHGGPPALNQSLDTSTFAAASAAFRTPVKQQLPPMSAYASASVPTATTSATSHHHPYSFQPHGMVSPTTLLRSPLYDFTQTQHSQATTTQPNAAQPQPSFGSYPPSHPSPATPMSATMVPSSGGRYRQQTSSTTPRAHLVLVDATPEQPRRWDEGESGRRADISGNRRETAVPRDDGEPIEDLMRGSFEIRRLGVVDGRSSSSPASSVSSNNSSSVSREPASPVPFLPPASLGGGGAVSYAPALGNSSSTWQHQSWSLRVSPLAPEEEPSPVDDGTTELVDVDQLTVEEAVLLFHRSDAVSEKWIRLLRDSDIEMVRDLRELRQHRNAKLWESFLSQHTLLKTMLETLLDEPQHFLPEPQHFLPSSASVDGAASTALMLRDGAANLRS